MEEIRILGCERAYARSHPKMRKFLTINEVEPDFTGILRKCFVAIDRFGRDIHYLRISLTDHCNLRCVYCMPEDMTFRPNPELMQDDEVITAGAPVRRTGLR